MPTRSLDNFGFSKTSNESVYYRYIVYGNLIKVGLYNRSGNTSLTYEFHEDTGAIIFNGTHTESDEFALYVSQPTILTIDAKVSGLPQGASATTYYFGGAGIGHKFDEDIIYAGVSFRLAIVIKKNVVCDNLVFRPMVRPAFQITSAWNPYSMRVQDLTKYVLDIDKERIFGLINYDGRITTIVSYWFNFNGDNNKSLYIDIAENAMSYTLFCGLAICRYGVYTLYVGTGSNGTIIAHNLTPIYFVQEYPLNMVVLDDKTIKIKPTNGWDTMLIFGKHHTSIGNLNFNLRDDE